MQPRAIAINEYDRIRLDADKFFQLGDFNQKWNAFKTAYGNYLASLNLLNTIPVNDRNDEDWHFLAELNYRQSSGCHLFGTKEKNEKLHYLEKAIAAYLKSRDLNAFEQDQLINAAWQCAVIYSNLDDHYRTIQKEMNAYKLCVCYLQKLSKNGFTADDLFLLAKAHLQMANLYLHHYGLIEFAIHENNLVILISKQLMLRQPKNHSYVSIRDSTIDLTQFIDYQIAAIEASDAAKGKRQHFSEKIRTAAALLKFSKFSGANDSCDSSPPTSNISSLDNKNGHR